MRASSEQMKFYLGYILSQGDDLINEIGLNPWVVNEGRADARDAHEVDWEIVQKYGLTYSGATAWFNKNYLNQENAPRGVMKYYLLEVFYMDSYSVRVFKSDKSDGDLTREFVRQKFKIGLSKDFDFNEIDLETVEEI
jgi:hypothetical protein